MSDYIQNAKLLEQNKRDLVKALNEIGLSTVTMETPMSKIAHYFKWSCGFAGCELLTIVKNSNPLQYQCFTAERWTAMNADAKSGYSPLGVILKAEGRSLVIAGNDCSCNGESTMQWSAERVNLADLPDIGATKNNPCMREGFGTMYDDFGGKEKTQAICTIAESHGVVYPAGQQCWAYKAFSGDPLQWWLPDISEWRLIDRYRSEINTALKAFFGSALSSSQYWTADEVDDVYGIYAWVVDADGRLDYGNFAYKTNKLCVRAVSVAPAI